MAGNHGGKGENLNQSLKESQHSARGLAFEMLGVEHGLGRSVAEAGKLAEALAKMSKIEGIAGAATGIGILVAAIGTAIALTVGWKEKTKELDNQWKEITAETAKYNALAAQDPRRAKLIEINEENRKAHAELEKQKGIVGSVADKLEEIRKKGGLLAALIPENSHVLDYDKISKAIDDRTAAEKRAYENNLYQVARERRLDISSEAHRNDPRLGLLDPYTQQLVQNEIERDIQKQQERRQDEKLGMKPEEVDDLVNLWDGVFDNIADKIYQTHIKQLGDQLGQSFASSIADGMARGIESGSVAEGFKALTGSLLIGLGQMMITIGTQSLLAANLFQSIIEALSDFAPLGAVGPSLALIALGGVLVGLGSSLGGRHGNSGRGGGGFGGSSGTTIIDRGLINPVTTAVTSPGKITPVAPVTNQIFLIGKDDPSAQRDLFYMINSAKKRQDGGTL